MKLTKYYMGFFKYDDTTFWQKTNLNPSKEDVEKYLNNLQYVNKDTIIIKEIELPE